MEHRLPDDGGRNNGDHPTTAFLRVIRSQPFVALTDNDGQFLMYIAGMSHDDALRIMREVISREEGDTDSLPPEEAATWRRGNVD